jgi:hypothetical protein
MEWALAVNSFVGNDEGDLNVDMDGTNCQCSMGAF